MSEYAWVIDRDHLDESSGRDGADAGVTGPRDAPDDLLERLQQGEGTKFTMRDDDGILYYSGRLVTTADGAGSEEACYGPLGDFGAPNAGCVEVSYRDRPEWDCG